MTARDMVVSAEADDCAIFGSLSEHLVYLFMRLHADRNGVFRLSMTEFAAQHNVNRQTILKHVESLLAKQLVTRQGHGRYRVHAEPWSLRTVAGRYLDTLQAGDEFDTAVFGKLAYGESLPWGDNDPRTDAIIEYTEKLERAGRLTFGDRDGEYHKVGRPKP